MKKCQVCDGPIVNGRCKLCGMPYRRDEELYHLNEDRSEHYRHASRSVQRKMREQEIPLADRKENRSIRENPEAERSLADLTKEQMRARRAANQARIEQAKRLQPKESVKPGMYPNKKKTVTVDHNGHVKPEKKKLGIGWIIWLILLLGLGNFSSCEDSFDLGEKFTYSQEYEEPDSENEYFSDSEI